MSFIEVFALSASGGIARLVTKRYFLAFLIYGTLSLKLTFQRLSTSNAPQKVSLYSRRSSQNRHPEASNHGLGPRNSKRSFHPTFCLSSPYVRGGEVTKRSCSEKGTPIRKRRIHFETPVSCHLLRDQAVLPTTLILKYFRRH